jgi:hypothetical protein
MIKNQLRAIRSGLTAINNLVRRKLIRPKVQESELVLQFKSRYLQFLEDPRRCNNMDDQQLLRATFLESHGKILDWALSQRSQRRRQKSAPNKSRFFPDLTSRKIASIVKQLRRNGYCVLSGTMPEAWVDTVRAATDSLNVVARADKSDVQLQRDLNGKSATYWHDQRGLAEIAELRELCGDAAIYAIATNYLRCQPVVDVIAAWWTFPVGSSAESASAQLYHFDLDRVKWLKVFVYLTDVDLDSGPHAYIRGSHNSIGQKIWRDGRYSDDEVFSVYSPNDEIKFTGPRGTVIIEDTLGFHKGVPAISGHRFIFEFQLSVNLFGYPYEALPWDVRPTNCPTVL